MPISDVLGMLAKAVGRNCTRTRLADRLDGKRVGSGTDECLPTPLLKGVVVPGIEVPRHAEKRPLGQLWRGGRSAAKR
jgi:hypothetical protein